MKRLIALVLVVLMLGSTAAFATVPDTKLGVSYTKDGVSGEASDLTNEGDKSMATELWLQVDADGQIDVTVPLLLVFRTNIDGGKAQAAQNYMIINNNNAPIVVTDVAITAGTKTNIPTTLGLVDYETGTLAEDKYKVQLTVDADAGSQTVFDFCDATDPEDPKPASYEKPASEGGLFKLNRTVDGPKPTDTLITADMATGAFSFVTKRTDDDKFVENNGVHLNTVTYTVAFDTSVQAGGAMTPAEFTNADPEYDGWTGFTATDNPDIP